MNGRVVLDTNIIIALWANDAAVTRQLGAIREVFVPVIALGELYYGARKSAWATRNLERIDSFAARSSVLVCTDVTAQHYGLVKDALRSKGKPIPENDIWIAAIAIQYGLTLAATRDDHFNQVDGLTVLRW